MVIFGSLADIRSVRFADGFSIKIDVRFVPIADIQLFDSQGWLLEESCQGFGTRYRGGMNRDEFFAQLQKLSPKEIEVRLSSWDKEKLVLVHEFLQQKQSKEAPSDQLVRAATDASWAAVEAATRAETRATTAIIMSVVAMLAAVASAVVAFLGLKY